MFFDIQPYVQPRNTRWIDDKGSRLAQARLAEDAGEADQDTEADSYASGVMISYPN
jgi:hypothetical protein